MFDELFGSKAKASAQVDLYLERMERVLRVKQMALETNEKKLSKDMELMITALVEVTNIELNNAIKEYKQAEKDAKKAKKETE